MHGRGRLRAVAIMMLLALLPAAHTLGLPAARFYNSDDNALTEPNAFEQQVFDLLQALRTESRLPPYEWHKGLSAVAREHSADMSENDYFDYYSLRLGAIEYRIQRAGISAPNARYAIFHVGRLGQLTENMTDNPTPFYKQPGSEIGVGVAKDNATESFRVTLITYERLSTLNPFPVMPAVNRRYTLAGRLNEGLTAPHLLITCPRGDVTDQAIELEKDRRFEVPVKFDKGRGEYGVEIIAEGRLGPMVVDLLHCYAGVRQYPPPHPQPEKVPTPVNLREAEQRLFKMILKARAAAGLPPLKYDERLATVGRAHSDDMMQNRFFAHISPTNGSVTERMERAGIKAKAFRENLAANTDLGAAHRGLMDSPGHRRNILDPAMTHVGVGIVKKDVDILYITEEFGQDFVSYDMATLSANLQKEINRLRVAAKAPELRRNSTLTRIALKNSQWMMEHNEQNAVHAMELLKEARLRMSVAAVALRSMDPPTAEDIGTVLEKKYRSIGVGIVQSSLPTGEKFLWATVLLGDR